MNQEEVFLSVIKTLNQLNLPYIITGAYASSIHGEPRATHDIDLQIYLTPKDINDIYNAFQENFYVSKEGIEDALKYRTMFNLIHLESQIKIDFWIPKQSEYDQERLKRRQEITISGIKTFVISPEDSILTKLDWHKKTELEKHFADALGIMRIQGDRLDFDYITSWVEKLSIEELWAELRNTAGKNMG